MRNFFVCLVILLLVGCKKDRLKDDKAVFVGKWKWVYTVKTIRACDDTATTTEILTPASTSTSFSLEFKEKGCVTTFKNGEELEKYRTVFAADGWRNNGNPNYTGYTYFAFRLNNKDENSFIGYINEDTLIELGYWFPYKLNGYDCVTYINYFVRE